MDQFFKNLPAIIEKAATSPLGIAALIILLLSGLAYVFFRSAHEKVRIIIFLAMLSGLLVFSLIVISLYLFSTPPLPGGASTSGKPGFGRPPVSPPTGPTEPREATAEVETLVAKWFAAYRDGRTDEFLAEASEPFYFDRRVILTKPDLRRAYETLYRQKGAAWREAEVQSIKVRKARELQGSGYDLSRDRVFRDLNLTLDDYVAIVTTKYHGQPQTLRINVRRTGDHYKVAGCWD
jgi:hypothetical protein